MNKLKRFGPVFIFISASLWAFDAVIRTVLTEKIPPASIVMYEHIVGFIVMIPFIILYLKKKGGIKNTNLPKLTKKDVLFLLLMTLFNSVLGTLLFTEALKQSFAIYDFVTPLLLQKLQPLIVIILSVIFLREKLNFKFLSLVPIALIGSYMVGFGTNDIELKLAGKELIFLLSIGAAFFWGSGIILNKVVLNKLNFFEANVLRFATAIPISFAITIILNQGFEVSQLDASDIARFVLIAFTTGAAAIFLYYFGLKNTQAKIATIVELAFPVMSLLIATTSFNPYGAPQILSLANKFGIIILLISIFIISFENNDRQDNRQSN